jgi:hypothetical protein
MNVGVSKWTVSRGLMRSDWGCGVMEEFIRKTPAWTTGNGVPTDAEIPWLVRSTKLEKSRTSMTPPP